VIRRVRAAPPADFVALRSSTAAMSWPSLLARQCWVSFGNTAVARAPSNVVGEDVTAWISRSSPSA
jgi:hypothetical protein